MKWKTEMKWEIAIEDEIYKCRQLGDVGRAGLRLWYPAYRTSPVDVSKEATPAEMSR